MFKKSLAALSALLGASAVFAQASAPAMTAVTVVHVDGLFAAICMFIAGWGAAILIGLALLGILFEHNGARGWAVFTALIFATCAYFFLHVSLILLAFGAIAYTGIGLVWSFWRYKRHVSKVVDKNCEADARTKEIALVRLHPKAMLGTITAWIMIWPFSMVENIVGDLITAIQMLVTKFFRSVYHKVYDSAVAALK
jgi:hypothetical protein